MGSLVKRGSNYYAKWRHDGKQFCKALRDEHGASITTLAEAEQAKSKLMELFTPSAEMSALEKIQLRIDRTKEEVDSLNPALTIAQTWPAFASSTSGRKPCEKSTLHTYENVWTQFQVWLEAEHPDIKTLRGVTWEIAKSYLDSIAKRGVSNGTYNGHLAVLRYVFKTLNKQAKLDSNVWLDFRPLEAVRESRRELTIDELTLVCSKAEGEMKTLLCIGLYTGLRLGDCATLKWGEVDLKRALIRRIPNKIKRKKGSKGLVQIYIHPVLLSVLSALPGSKTDGYVLPDTAGLYTGPRRSSLAQHIQQHFESCGIETKKERENGVRKAVDVGFHSLRHSFVSMCALNNVPLSVVQSLIGHSSPLMTSHYSHSNRAAEHSAIALLPSIGGDTVEATKPAGRTRDELLCELLESMTVTNWREKKAAALALMSQAVN